VYIDIKDAFPSVDHGILLDKLRAVNDLGISNCWFSSYLSDRRIFVNIDDVNSETVRITRGIPQGSLLGPLLFNIYYDDIVTKFDTNNIVLYADDTAIVSAAESTTLLLRKLQMDLHVADSHLCSLRMKLNARKTFFMLYKNSNYANVQLSLNDHSHVNQCDVFKYLGVYIDSDMTWSSHINNLINKVHRNLYILHRSSHKSNRATLALLFRAYIYPHFVYGIQLYMLCSVALRAKLEVLFRRCCRLALRDNGPIPLIANHSVYRLLDVLPLRFIFQYSSATLLYKVLILRQVPALYSLFDIVQSTHYNCRRIPHTVVTLRVPKIRQESSKSSFAYWGAKLWNSIPVEIKRSESLAVFARLYHNHLSSNLRTFLSDNYDLLDFV
jgi:hypothetical protein